MRVINDDLINEVRSKNNLLEIVKETIYLERKIKKGKTIYKGICHFHPDKAPGSLLVNEEKQIWHCFGCGHGGDIIAFVMRENRWDFVTAIIKLAKRAGIKMTCPIEFFIRNEDGSYGPVNTPTIQL